MTPLVAAMRSLRPDLTESTISIVSSEIVKNIELVTCLKDSKRKALELYEVGNPLVLEVNLPTNSIRFCFLILPR